jgi:excisionase family DNA binding protein
MEQETNPTETRFLSARQAATRLGVSSETVKSWIRHKGLPAKRLPDKAYRIDLSI